MKTIPIKQNISHLITYHLKQNLVFIPDDKTYPTYKARCCQLYKWGARGRSEQNTCKTGEEPFCHELF